MPPTAQPSPGFAQHPDYQVKLEPCPRRVRVEFAGEIIADSTETLYLFETKHLPVYYFPHQDVRTEFLQQTDHRTHCPFKGDASYWDVCVDAQVAHNAVWGYQQPYREVPKLRGLLAFYWERMDRWFEEDEQVFVHPRDPYKRVDVVASHRSVQVVVGDTTVAATERARFLFETALPTRYYIPAEDVRMDLLVPSDTRTRCPYKGIAHHWSVRVGEQLYQDLAWSYPEPIEECPKIRDLMCFYNENVEAIYVDGKRQPAPRTQWSR